MMIHLIHRDHSRGRVGRCFLVHRPQHDPRASAVSPVLPQGHPSRIWKILWSCLRWNAHQRIRYEHGASFSWKRWLVMGSLPPIREDRRGKDDYTAGLLFTYLDWIWPKKEICSYLNVIKQLNLDTSRIVSFAIQRMNVLCRHTWKDRSFSNVTKRLQKQSYLLISKL